MMQDTTSPVIVLTSGFGGGKTWILVRKAIQLLLLNPGEDLILTEPTGPMITTVLLPEMHKALKDFGLSYEFKVAERIFYVSANGHTSRLICLSMENYNRIRGQNVCAVLADEAATTKDEILDAAVNMFKARLRAGTIRQLILVSTPENFGTLYKIAVLEADKYKTRWIKACTFDNPHVPKQFIEDMQAIYTPEQIRSYVYGEFSNMNSESVFDFNRELNHASVSIDTSDNDIYIACDFNVGGSVTIFALFQDDQIYVFGELVTKSTFETRDALRDMFPTQNLWCAADASGSNGASNASQTDHDLLLEVPGLSLIQGQRNPKIQDSVLSVNSGLRNQKIWIDTDKCPELTKALEQHTYGSDCKPEKHTNHKGGSIDDFSDCIRYLTWAILPVNKPTFQQYNQN